MFRRSTSVSPPNGGCQDKIIGRINRSKKTIDLAIYSFTSSEIAAALGAAADRGVKIRIVRDSVQSANKNDENSFLKSHQIEIQLHAGKGRYSMHNKFAIFDGDAIFTGSYNWTNNAEFNNWEKASFIDDSALAANVERKF